MSEPWDPEALRLHLMGLASEQVVKYPQYVGHFDNYRLARVRRNIRTKMGLAFRKGEIVIYTLVGGDPQQPVAWSMSNEVDTHLDPGDLEPIATESGGR